jgi:hypothetical protein
MTRIHVRAQPRLESGNKVVRIVYDQHTLQVPANPARTLTHALTHRRARQNRFFYTGGSTSVRIGATGAPWRTAMKGVLRC